MGNGWSRLQELLKDRQLSLGLLPFPYLATFYGNPLGLRHCQTKTNAMKSELKPKQKEFRYFQTLDNETTAKQLVDLFEGKGRKAFYKETETGQFMVFLQDL